MAVIICILLVVFVIAVMKIVFFTSSNDDDSAVIEPVEVGANFFYYNYGLYKFELQGLYYRSLEAKEYASHVLRLGENLELIPEPENDSDPNAVGVYTLSGLHIGYVPKELAPRIKQMIEVDGVNFGTHIVSKSHHDLPFFWVLCSPI